MNGPRVRVQREFVQRGFGFAPIALLLPIAVVAQIEHEARRCNVDPSAVVQRAWLLGRPILASLPSEPW